ncbi:MAG: glycosyltransferase family 9 protein, partial [Chitinophagales bacterium]|nr:glycosyltransferase family 9 protein [Chitinophagales bacterium]
LYELYQENYDIIVDLHNNLRSNLIKLLLWRNTFTVKKLSFLKWLLVHFKINFLPEKIHITDRNLAAIAALGIKDDDEGMNYFISPEDEVNISELGLKKEQYIAWVVGAKHFTKIYPAEKARIAISQFLIKNPEYKIVLVGGTEDVSNANIILKETHSNIINLCGKLNLSQSASVIKQSALVISGDTGLLHIAVALGKPVVSIWGGTVPEFGVFPKYNKYNQQPHAMIEHKSLFCRPCSRYGRPSCPKKHFRCMLEISPFIIVEKTEFILKHTKTN